MIRVSPFYYSTFSLAVSDGLLSFGLFSITMGLKTFGGSNMLIVSLKLSVFSLIPFAEDSYGAYYFCSVT